jgi:nitroimidazol reductase NimA-like FMN-containing flavoprotein (pyridoxamine 5'-phosphate oxidase superfamily)
MVSSNFAKVKRHPERGNYDRELLLDILGNGLVCQVAFQVEGQPFIIPMSYYNNKEFIFIHCSPVARISKTLKNGGPVAISVLELNGLVIAKGLADNSMNYRSAIIFGKPVELVSDEEKMAYFKEWIDHLMPGRKENSELPSKDELSGVAVFKVRIDQFSIKVREGGPSELRKNPEIWSGVIPISTRFSAPSFASSPEYPEHIKAFIDERNRI